MTDLEIQAQASSGSSGLTIELVAAKLEARNFPIRIIEAGLSSLIDEALAKLGAYSPVTSFAVFNTKEGQRDYFIFDPDDPDLAGFAMNATSINEVYWNSSGVFTDLELFYPGWFNLPQAILLTGSDFYKPSLMTLMRQNLASWDKQFRSNEAQVVGSIGAPGAKLRLSPTPQADNIKVIVEFGIDTQLDQITKIQTASLMDWVCHYAAESIASKYATTAGISLLGFADSTAAMKYWTDKAQWYYRQCMTHQAGLHGEAGRS